MVMAELKNLVPVIIPRAYLAYDNWPGPYRLLKHPELALTWVTLELNQWMNYLTKEKADAWAHDGFDYESVALENLARFTGSAIGTHHKLDTSGNLVFTAMMHEDGLGSSRVLLHADLSQAFPQGYWVAIPERSCALVIPKRVSAEGFEEVKGLARKCWEEGTTPMLPDLLEPEDVLIETAV